MKVVAICGSHRKGNTEWMLNNSAKQGQCEDVPGMLKMRKRRQRPQGRL